MVRGGALKRVSVVLTTAVKGLGAAGDVVSVRPGHARNSLVPDGLATYMGGHTRSVHFRWRC